MSKINKEVKKLVPKAQLTKNFLLIDEIVDNEVKDDVTESGIILQGSAKKHVMPKGLVIKTGPGLPDANGKIIPMRFKAGDIVFFGPNNLASKVMFDVDQDYIFMSAEEVVAVIEK